MFVGSITVRARRRRKTWKASDSKTAQGVAHMNPCKNRYGYLAMLLLLWNICMVVPADAQVAGGIISGTVTDNTGAAIPQAQISITNRATDVTRQVVANGDGFYSAPNLQPGEYQVKA